MVRVGKEGAVVVRGCSPSWSQRRVSENLGERNPQYWELPNLEAANSAEEVPFSLSSTA